MHSDDHGRVLQRRVSGLQLVALSNEDDSNSLTLQLIQDALLYLEL